MAAVNEPQVIRIIVTGSRRIAPSWTDYVRQLLDAQIRPAVSGPQIVIVHGAARGVDTIAHEWAQSRPGCTPEPHPAEWATYGSTAGPRRNQEMVLAGAELCLAFPNRRRSPGTWNCIHTAAAYGIPSQVFPLPEA